MTGAVRARRKAERPSEILEAAFEEFALHGYAATRLEDVAARAGVTKGTIYVYFQNKEQVFEALAVQRGQELFDRALPFIEDTAEPTPESVRADLTFLFRTCLDDRRSLEILRLLISEAVRFPKLVDQHFQSFFAPVIDKLKQKVQRVVKSGGFRASPAADYPELLMAPALTIHIWTLLFADRRPLDIDRYLEASVDLIMNGLLPPPDSSSQ
ncbi:TetR/AcrR family transcriptional regulator [Hyphomicrobium sp. 1Nfss2.1]|uniref:TetR/AcrR family transcriptional regulator n=1 Tax=Hyphomicrobium sp. 1Nfss2.1 TaxID=3413936 RepID=UPI003C7A9FF3